VCKVSEENNHYPGPYDSEEMLFSAINGTPEGLEVKDLEEIVDKENMGFYPGDCLMSVLIEGLLDGRIVYDEEKHLYKPGLLVPDGD
jgi:hypothetical protein